MKLGVKDRLMLLGCIPQRGDILTLRIVQELQRKLGLSEKELKLLKVVQNDGNIAWDQKAETKMGLVEVPIGEKAKELIATQIKAMSDQEGLVLDHLAIIDKLNLKIPGLEEETEA